MAVMYKPIYYGAGKPFVIENIIPLAKLKIGCNDNASLFIAIGNNLKQKLSSIST